MKKIQAVIFDWAGTTVDFGCFAPVQAFIEAFKSFGINPTVDQVRAPMGMLKWDHIHTMMKMPTIASQWQSEHKRVWNNDDVDRVYQKSETVIFDILHNFASVKPFVQDTVTKLRQRDIKIGSSTGYTDKMMEIVVAKAAENGYKPDAWFTPNSVENYGRPYPYMIFKNLQALRIDDIKSTIKVGDTISDIKEAQNAGILSVGVIEGSSIMGLSEDEYTKLTDKEKELECARIENVYQKSGADYVIKNMSELCNLIDKIEN